MSNFDDAFAYAIANEKRIRSLLLKVARGDHNCADEMFSDVVLERLPRLFELYDGIRPLENYMLNNIRWYAFKYVNKKYKRTFEDLTYLKYKDPSSFLDALEYLNEMERYLVEAVVFYRMSHREIAAQLNRPVSHVSAGVQHVFEKLRIIYTDE